MSHLVIEIQPHVKVFSPGRGDFPLCLPRKYVNKIVFLLPPFDRTAGSEGRDRSPFWGLNGPND